MLTILPETTATESKYVGGKGDDCNAINQCDFEFFDCHHFINNAGIEMGAKCGDIT